MKKLERPRYYSYFVHINPFVRTTEWEAIATRTQEYFLAFLNCSDYGDRVMPISFQFFVEQPIDFYRQHDVVSTSNYLGIPKSVKLCTHIDYEQFISSDSDRKFTILANGLLYLLRYWQTYLRIPEGTPLDQIVSDFAARLEQDRLLWDDLNTSAIFIKPENPTRLYFLRHKVEGIDPSNILFDDQEVERAINNSICHIKFGKSIQKLYFSYDILSGTGSSLEGKDIVFKLGKDRQLMITWQFFANDFLGKERKIQLSNLQDGILKALSGAKNMKRKPKEFDFEQFGKAIEKAMDLL